MSTVETQAPKTPGVSRKVVDRVTVRFAGDSGDGVQLTGSQFTTTTAIAGNDLATVPDYPAEIRAPAGTLPGVSAYQIQFSSSEVHTAGDQPDVLVVFNPAALRVHINDLGPNGIVVIDTNQFDAGHLAKAGYEKNPLEDGSLNKYRVIKENLTEKTLLALKDLKDVSAKEKARCKNFFALGVAYWLFNRPLETTLKYISDKFKKDPDVCEANRMALKAGFSYCEMTDMFQAVAYEIPPAPTQPGLYRNISGNQALAMGLIAASVKSGRTLFYGAYPITPASDILHELSKLKNFGVVTFQAEDEIAALAATIGAAYAGSLGVTGTSGPGIALKAEAAGLAVMTELPVVIIDVQRGGPSTGLPTKTEQADLMQALYSRHGESPAVIIAPATPGENFDFAYEACRLAIKYMVPVYMLSDGYLANGAEPWKVPATADLKPIPVEFASNPENFLPYRRNPETLARPWAIPGTPGLEHRIGGIEKRETVGTVSYEPDNHERMVVIRAEKVARIAKEAPPLKIEGDQDAELLIVGWGSTYGAIRAGIELAHQKGLKVAHAHIRYLNPFPANTGEVIKKFKKVMCPEMNMGQLSLLLRGRFLVDIVPLNQVKGQPFKAREILAGIEAVLAGKPVVKPGQTKQGAEDVLEGG